jgi:hypothetical protein
VGGGVCKMSKGVSVKRQSLLLRAKIKFSSRAFEQNIEWVSCADWTWWKILNGLAFDSQFT